MKVVIIGGVAGGAACAARLRRVDETAEIVVLEKGRYISFANCGMPYYLGGVITDRHQLLVQTPEKFKQMFNVEVRTQNEVTRINRAAHTLTVIDHRANREYTESYDKLVLTPGARPRMVTIDGLPENRVAVLRSLEDMDAIQARLEREPIRTVTVIGGGFIGLELAENFHERGYTVDLVEAAPQVMAAVDFEMAAMLHNHLAAHGINSFLGKTITRAWEEDGRVRLVLSDGKEITTDLVIVSIGVVPATELAAAAGLELGALGGIKVDERLQTTDPDIYAAGDAIEITNRVTGEPALIPLAGPAGKQARVIANRLSGKDDRYAGSIATSIAKVFDLTVAACGLNRRYCEKFGIKSASVIIHAASHAGYYPGALPMSIKLLYCPETERILGGQIIGKYGVDKRIEIIAAYLMMQGTVSDLARHEQAYAPPFSSAKDPVNIAAYAAENAQRGLVRNIDCFAVAEKVGKAFIIDVRGAEEFTVGHIETAVNIPLPELRQQLDRLPRDREILVYCQVGLRSYLASRLLLQRGFDRTSNLSGGYKTYQNYTTGSRQEYFAEEVCINDHLEQKTGVGGAAALDLCGLACPGPLVKLTTFLKDNPAAATVTVSFDDDSFATDLRAFCESKGFALRQEEAQGKTLRYTLERGAEPATAPSASHNKTMVVFSDDLDKAIASFIIANGARAVGHEVTMFFTFWGLNIIKARRHCPASPLLRMFSFLMPATSRRLALSKFNFGGIGPRLIRGIMTKNNVPSLESLISQAREQGVRLIACQMTLDLLGIDRSELLPGVETGGVGTFIAEADKSNMSLFI